MRKFNLKLGTIQLKMIRIDFQLNRFWIVKIINVEQSIRIPTSQSIQTVFEVALFVSLYILLSASKKQCQVRDVFYVIN